MTIYVIEDDDGFVLDRVYLEFTSDVDRAMLFDEPIAPAEYAKRYGGHVVELVEKPEPVETSEDTVAKILREAKRYADDYISEDKLKFEIKTALSVYKPAPEVVSEAEAEMLDALSDGELMPICELSYYVHHAESLSEKEAVKR
jgi:beta-glucosidase/6-phospho-beta-glucosidase/beta-galactosidase